MLAKVIVDILVAWEVFWTHIKFDFQEDNSSYIATDFSYATVYFIFHPLIYGEFSKMRQDHCNELALDKTNCCLHGTNDNWGEHFGNRRTIDYNLVLAFNNYIFVNVNNFIKI